MRKQIGTALLLLCATQAHAAFQCNVNLKDDVIITSESVKLVGASGDLQVLPNGSVRRGGQDLSLTAKAKEKAIAYQAMLRRDLPLIETQVQQQLQQAHKAVDNVIVREMGNDSKVRSHAGTLAEGLKSLVGRVVEKNGESSMTFHHAAVAQIEQEVRTKVESTLGAIVQDSVNEMGAKSLSTLSSGNQLQSMLGGLGNLQQALRSEWSTQQKSAERFAQDVCQRVTSLEAERVSLLKMLP